MKQYILLFFLYLAVAIPVASAPQSIKQIEIRVLPKSEGLAFCRYRRNGKLHGGHTSGGPAIRVYEADGDMPRPAVEEAWKLAADIRQRGLVIGPVIWDAHSRGKIHIVLTLEDGSELSLSWPEREKHQDPAVQKLGDLLFKHKVGGW